jgi:hypothetical protein
MQNHISSPTKPSQQRTTVENERLQKALAARERFLCENPHLGEYQTEIDRVLDMSGSEQGRMAVLGTMLQGKLLEMQRELNKLTVTLRETAE